MDDRVILHCDCNSFFASVETALNPEYKNVPMAVCGSVEDRHGIVLAKNELAKKFGIQTAETVYSAKRKCPGLVLASPHYDKYCEYSKRVNKIYADYTDLIEPFGIDESWLDVTASQRFFGSGNFIAEKIRSRVKEEIGITVSIGVSFNKVFAKLGSDYKKPDAITVIDKTNFQSIVYPLPASDLLFVGKKTAESLKNIGIFTIGDLAACPLETLALRFGKMGEMLFKYSRGLDDSPVCSGADEDAKSVGNGFTFKHDLITKDDCRLAVDYLCDEIGSRLRNKGLKCSTVCVSIKDDNLKVIQRQNGISVPTDISSEIADHAFEILKREWNIGNPIRTITVTATNLIKHENEMIQMDFFADQDEEELRSKVRLKEQTVDLIKKKYGSSAIVRGAVIDNDIGVYQKKTK